MLTQTANGNSRLSLWLRVREYAVPPSMIETATARRHAGDWAGACAAAGVDVDLDPRSVLRTHGRELATRVRADLRRLAPDLLRWHLPRVAPDGLLRPGLTIALARYDADGPDGTGPVQLVARTPPAWADGGQRISLALWDGSRPATGDVRHPRSRPSRRFRLDLHRHLWDADRSHELRIRSGAGQLPTAAGAVTGPDPLGTASQGLRCAVDRWAAEAGILLRSEGRPSGDVTVRVGARHRLVLHPAADGDGPGPPGLRITAAPADAAAGLPVLPDAATWVLPDLELIRAGLIEAGRLHPLVASALDASTPAPGRSATGPAPIPGRIPAPIPGRIPDRIPDRAGEARLVECRGARHRIGLVDGVLAPLDHDPAEIRREDLLAALTGTPLPCLRAISEAHRHPDRLTGVRERLDHGDTAGALAVVEGLLGPGAVLRSAALRDELETVALRRIAYRLFRAGLTGPGPGPVRPDLHAPRHPGTRTRRATSR